MSFIRFLISIANPGLETSFLFIASIEDIIVARRKDGASTFERLKEEDYTSWLEDYTVGELWTKNVIQGGTSHE